MKLKEATNILRAFVLSQSKVVTRSQLKGIYVKPYMKNGDFDLVSTDGSILLLGQYCAECYPIFRLIVPTLPEEVTEGKIFEEKIGGVSVFRFVKKESDEHNYYPKYEEIFLKDWTNPADKYPAFSFDVIERAHKIYKLLGYKENLAYFPKRWNSDIGVTEDYWDHYSMIVMPVRKPKVTPSKIEAAVC